MSDCNGKCDDCGRFMKYEGGASAANIYDFVAMEQITTRIRCPKCTETMGPVKSNARPSNGDMSQYQWVYP